MSQLVTWFSSNTAAALGIFGAAAAFIVSTVLQIFQRRAEANERQFQAYHQLIERLVSRDRDGQPMYVDRQAAVVFELRHFPRYYDFTERLLDRLRSDWVTNTNPLTPIMTHEIDLTLEHIKKKK
jgi:type II secretory pathway pseudopilin PulG